MGLPESGGAAAPQPPGSYAYVYKSTCTRDIGLMHPWHALNSCASNFLYQFLDRVSGMLAGAANLHK